MSLYAKMKCIVLSWLLVLEFAAMPLSYAQTKRQAKAPIKAKNKSEGKRLLFKWVPSQLVEKNVGEQKISLRTFERHVWFGQRFNVPIANMTFLKTEKMAAKDKQPVSEVLALVRNTIKDAKWTQVASTQGEMYQGDWDKLNRIILVYAYDLSDAQVVVTGFVRKGFAPVALKEMRQIMLAAAEYDLPQAKSNERKTTMNWLKNLIIDDVYAQTMNLPNLNGLGNYIPGWNIGAGSGGVTLPNTWPAGVGQPLQVQSNVTIDSGPNLNNQFDSLNGNMSDGVKQWDQSNQNWHGTNGQLETLNGNIKDANQNWSDSNHQMQNANEQLKGINGNWASTNTQLNRLNGSLEKLTDPGHMLKVGMATSAGMVLGGFLMNMVIDGAIQGVSSLWQWLSGARDKKDRAQRFELAVSHYDEVKARAVTLERSLDNFLQGLAAINDGDLEKTLKDASFVRDLNLLKHFYQQKARMRQRQAEFDPADDEAQMVCKVSYSLEAEELAKWANAFDSILKFATNGKDYTMRTLCAKLDAYLQELVLAEALLLKLKIFQLAGQDLFFEKEMDDLNRMFDLGDGIADGDYVNEGDIKGFREDLKDRTQAAPAPKISQSDADGDEAPEGREDREDRNSRGKAQEKMQLSQVQQDRHEARANQKAPSWVNICAGRALKPKPEHGPIYQELYDRVGQIDEVNEYNRASQTRNICWDYYEDVVLAQGGDPSGTAAAIPSAAVGNSGNGAGAAQTVMEKPARPELSTDQLLDQYSSGGVTATKVNSSGEIVFNRQSQERVLNARIEHFNRMREEAACHDEVLTNRRNKRDWCHQNFPEIYKMIATQAKAQDLKEKKCAQYFSGLNGGPAASSAKR